MVGLGVDAPRTVVGAVGGTVEAWPRSWRAAIGGPARHTGPRGRRRRRSHRGHGCRTSRAAGACPQCCIYPDLPSLGSARDRLAPRPFPAARPRAVGARARATAPLRCRALHHLPTRPGRAVPGRRGDRLERVCRGAGQRAGGRWFGRRKAAADDGRGHLPRRRVRRRQDAPARVAVARGRWRQGLRHVRGVHEPRRRARIPADRRGAERAPAGLHRRVRARRPRRHGPDGDAARDAGRRRCLAGRHVQHAARRPRGRAGSPRRTSCARSRRCRRASRC